MRTLFIDFIDANNEVDASEAAPWAAVIIVVEGGYMCFESMTDYETFIAQE